MNKSLILALFYCFLGLFSTPVLGQIEFESSYYHFSESQEIPWSGVIKNQDYNEIQFLEAFQKDYFNDNQVTFVELKRTDDDLGFTHVKYQQKRNGIDVNHGILNLHIKNGLVESYNGQIYTKFIDHSVTEIDVEKIKAKHRASSYDNVEARKMMYASNVSGSLPLRPAFVYLLSSHEPFLEDLVFFDPVLEEIILVEPQLIHTDSVGSASTYYRGTQTITTDHVGKDSFRLRQSAIPIQVSSGAAGTDLWDKDNYWNNSGEKIATDVMWGNTLTGEFLDHHFSWDSYENTGDTIRSVLNFGGSGNAFWNLNGNFATYLVGSSATVNPCASLDVVGHEIGHGIADENAGLVYTGESCMLHESFADINGTLIEMKGAPSAWDWVIGDQVWSGGIRDMSDPGKKGMPKYYKGNNWGGGCHSPGGVQNYWYYLIHHGDTGKNEKGYNYSIEGLGLDDAVAVTYRSMFYYVTSNTGYPDIAKHTLKAAKDLFGTCSEKYEMVYEAWKVVGLEDTTMKGVDVSHGIVTPTLVCKGPNTDITLNSIGDVSRKVTWYFANGDSLKGQSVTRLLQWTGKHRIISKTEVCDFTFRDTVDVVLNYNPKPEFNLATTDFCQSHKDSVTVVNKTVNQDQNISMDYLWYLDPSTVISEKRDFTFPLNLNYDFDVVLTASYKGGCSTTKKVKVSMKPLPEPIFTTTNSCQNEAIKINNKTNQNEPVSFQWFFPDGTVSTKTDPTYIPTQSGDQTIRMIATMDKTGCVDSTQESFDAFELPTADFTHKGACFGSDITFIDLSTYAEGKAWNEWDFGIFKPFNKDTVTFQPNQAGDLSIKLKISDKKGCENSITKMVHVENLKSIIEIENTLCETDSVLLKHTSTGGINTVEWSDYTGVLSNSDSVYWHPASVETFDISLYVASDHCEHTSTTKVTVNAIPKLDISIDDACAGDTVFFKNNTPELPEGIQYSWLYGTGENNSEKEFHYLPNETSTTNFNAKVVATTGKNCESTVISNYTVNELPSCGYTFEHNGKKNGVVFKANQVDGVAYEWILGDGETATGDSIVYVYSNDERRIVTLKVTNAAGCSCSDSMAVRPVSLGVHLTEQEQFDLYPNPSEGIIFISTERPMKNAQIVVFDAMGREMFNTNKTLPSTVNLQQLPSGMYWMAIKFEGNQSFQKLTIQH